MVYQYSNMIDFKRARKMTDITLQEVARVSKSSWITIRKLAAQLIIELELYKDEGGN